MTMQKLVRIMQSLTVIIRRVLVVLAALAYLKKKVPFIAKMEQKIWALFRKGAL